MIRIFVIGFSANKGGVESYISNLCSCLNQEEFEVIYSMPQMLIKGKLWTRPQNRHNYIKYSQFWKAFYKENYFDVVYLNTCDLVSIDDLIFAKRAGVPVRIIHSHNTGIQQKMNVIHWCLEKWNRVVLHKYATHLFACSQVAGKWMFDKRQFTVIKNGIKLSKFVYSGETRENKRNKLKIKNQFVVGCVGRLEPQKNPVFSIEVFEKIARIREDAILVFVGEGDLQDALRSIVDKKGLQEKVVFLGARNDIHELMSVFDCLLMPSFFEGLPFVLVEAQASGLPCIVSENVSKEADLTGLVEFISLDESKDIWAKKILEKEKIQRRNYAERLMEQGYSIEETGKNVCNILRTALNK